MFLACLALNDARLALSAALSPSRFGEPLTHDDAAAWHVPEPFTPFDAKSEKKHRALFQSHVDEIMRRIDGLVDEPYRFAPDATSDGVKGSHRFV